MSTSSIFKEKIVKNLNSENLNLAKQIHRGGGSAPEAYAFIISSLRILFKKNFSFSDFQEIITDGGEDGSIDVFYSDDRTCYIMDIKDSKFIKTSDITKFSRDLEEYVFQQPETKKMQKLNRRVKNKLEKFHKHEFKKNIIIYVIRNSEKGFSNKDKYDLNELKNKYNSIKEVVYLNRNDLVDRLYESENFLENWRVKLTDKKDILFSSDDNKELIVKIPLVDLIKLQEKANKNNKNLYNKNIRVFLNNKTVKSGIIETIKNDPKNFHIYHNGIVMVVKKIKTGSSSSFIFKNPQILNGCQSINTLYEKFKDYSDGENLKFAKIICKINETEDEKLIDKICEASNTQARIQNYDLRANDDIQILIQKFINNIPKKKYYYERKRSKRKIKNKIKMTEFAQWSYSCLFNDPALPKNSMSKLFEIIESDSIYYQLFNEKKLTPAKIEKISSIGLFVKEKKKSMCKDDKKELLKHAELHIVAGMYYLNKINDKVFNKVFSEVKRVASNKKKNNPELDNNKIFTKDKETWMQIKKKLK